MAGGKTKPNYCSYCGDYYQCRDHVIPVSWNDTYRTYRPGDTVPCCRECNGYLGNKPLFNLPDRANYLTDVYLKKKGAILKFKGWSPEELRDVGYNIREQIEKRLYLKEVYSNKLMNLGLVSSGCEPYPIHALPGEKFDRDLNAAMYAETVKELKEMLEAPVSNLRKCDICGKPFPFRYRGKTFKRYCSGPCRVEADLVRDHSKKQAKREVMDTIYSNGGFEV